MKKLCLLAFAGSCAMAASAENAADVYSKCDTVYSALRYNEAVTDWRSSDIVNWSENDSIWGWVGGSYNHYLIGTTYDSKGHAGIGYALSPIIDLGNLPAAYVSFNHAAKYQQTLRDLGRLCLWVQGSVVERPLEIPVWPDGGSWKWCNSGYINLSEFLGKKVRLGFRYESVEGGNDTWQIDNLVVTTSVPRLNPGVIYFGLPSDSWVGYHQWESLDINRPDAVSSVWGNYCGGDGFYARGTAYVSGSNEALAYFRSPEIDLTGVDRCSVSFDHAARYQTTLKSLCKACVWLDGNLEEPVLLDIPVWPKAGEWDDVNSGKIDLTPFCGHKIRFGFRYESTSAGADTWNVRNVVVRDEGSASLSVTETAPSEASRKVYNLSGIKADADLPGYYIVREGASVTKQLLR